MFSVLPAILISSTYTDENSFFAWLRTNSFREERLDLPYQTMIRAICVLVDVSKYQDILTLGIFNNFGASSIFTWCKRMLRLLLVLRILVVSI